MFKIIKKGSGNFWHNFNNGSKEVNLSDWEIVLDSVNQTVSLQMLNGANIPNNSVIISDVVVIDETDGSIEETFGSVSILRTRLIELNYTPYIVLNGFVPEAPIDGLTYGRKDAEWVEVSGGGSVGTLQQVTDNGNTIVSGDFQANFEASAIEVTNQLTGTGTSIDATEGVVIKTGSFQGKVKTDNLTAVRTNQLPDKNITFAGIDDIPTDLSELNDDSTHRLVTDTQISTWDGKQNTLTETNFGSFINGLTAKNTLVDADEVVSDDSADSNKAKKTSWLNVWLNYLKPKADALYQAILTDVPIKSIVADYTTSSGVTGTTSETLISSYKINANTLSSLDFMNMTLRLLKTGVTAGYLITIRIGTTSTFSTSLTQIAQYGNTLSTGVDVNFQRYFKIEGGSLKGSNFTFNILGNQGVSVNYSENSTPFNVSVDNWIFISVKPQSNNADVITQSIFKITN